MSRFAIVLPLIIGLAALTCPVAAADAPPKDAAGPNSTDQPPDLRLRLPIKLGDYEHTVFLSAIPGFAVGSVSRHTHPDETRLMVAVRFTSRSVQTARLSISVFREWKDSEPLCRVSHVEQLGPEEVRTKGPNLDAVRRWDDTRALWFDLPLEAKDAQAIEIELRLTPAPARADG